MQSYNVSTHRMDKPCQGDVICFNRGCAEVHACFQMGLTSLRGPGVGVSACGLHMPSPITRSGVVLRHGVTVSPCML